MVNTAFFMQIILADYVGSILGLVRDGLTWRLDPLAVCLSCGVRIHVNFICLNSHFANLIIPYLLGDREMLFPSSSICFITGTLPSVNRMKYGWMGCSRNSLRVKIPERYISFPSSEPQIGLIVAQLAAKDFRKVVREKIVPAGEAKTWTFGKCVLPST